MTVQVVYHNGAFIPKGNCSFDEGTEGFVVVESPIETSAITDPVERRRLLGDLLEDMRRHPLPPDHAKLTRDQLHERG